MLSKTITLSLRSVALGIGLVALVGLTAFVKPESKIEAEVREALDAYIEGAKLASADRFERAFDTAVADMKFVSTNRETGEQQVRSVPITDAIASWTSRPAEESWGKVVDINVVDDQLAHATVELLWRGTIYVDVMSLYPVNGEWRIVQKTFVSRGPVDR